MAQDFSDFTEAVTGLMEEFGISASLHVQVDSGVYDPLTGTNAFTYSEIAITGILMDLTLQSNGLGTKVKTLIKAGDKVFYVQPSTTLLPILTTYGIIDIDTSDDKIVINGNHYKISTCKSMEMGGPTIVSPLFYELYLKR